MPHIAFPMRFIMPLDYNLRISNKTPVSRVLSIIMPWLRGRRPNWLIRLGLLLYDKLGRTSVLQSTTAVDLHKSIEGKPLKNCFSKGYEYQEDYRIWYLGEWLCGYGNLSLWEWLHMTRVIKIGLCCSYHLI